MITLQLWEMVYKKLCMNLLDRSHDAIDYGDVVDTPRYKSGLIEESPRLSDRYAHSNTPQEEHKLSYVYSLLQRYKKTTHQGL